MASTPGHIAGGRGLIPPPNLVQPTSAATMGLGRLPGPPPSRALMPYAGLAHVLRPTPAMSRPQLIPEEFEFDASGDNSWISVDQTTHIQNGTHVRVRIVGIKYDPTEVVSCTRRASCGRTVKNQPTRGWVEVLGAGERAGAGL